MNLQQVHAVRYHKALVDIISMVKHAVREQEPLLTATERVERALTKITKGQKFKPTQQRWLDRIRQHLVTNLTIDREDFDALPIFTRDGGWAVADRTFDGKLKKLISELNSAIAA